MVFRWNLQDLITVVEQRICGSLNKVNMGGWVDIGALNLSLNKQGVRKIKPVVEGLGFMYIMFNYRGNLKNFKK